MDCLRQVPPILKDRGLFPLPVTNGEYRLIRGTGFHELEPIDDPVHSFTSRLDFELCTLTGEGESMFLNYAFNSGLISYFTGKNDIIKGNEGRKFANRAFSFNVGSVGPIEQNGTQIQVDGLFEGPDSVMIMEAKTTSNNDFIIRQLYYPLRYWRSETEKELFTIFLHIDKRSKVYSFWHYQFGDTNDYSSIDLVRAAKFTIQERPRQSSELEDVTPERDLVYVPQANDVDKILKVPYLVSQGFVITEAIAQEINFTARQGNYYSEAAEGLGLINRQQIPNGGYNLELTEIGRALNNARPDERASIVAHQMMKLPFMNAILNELVEMNTQRISVNSGLSKGDIARLIEVNSRYSGSTPLRRASSVIRWFEWLSANYGLFQVRNGHLYLYRHIQSRIS